MTIQEAINSGRPFRRKGWAVSGKMDDDWVYDSTKQDHGFVYMTTEVEAVFHREDFLADDWEVKLGPLEFDWVVDPHGVHEGQAQLIYYGPNLMPFVGKRVKVTVEELAE